MTDGEARAAFMRKTPVEFDGIAYQRITAIIYRLGADGLYMQAEILDKNGNSVSIVNASRIKEGGADEQS